VFTWEEAGLLRQMLLIIKWTLTAAAVAVAVWLHQPLTDGILWGVHAVESTFKAVTHPHAGALDSKDATHR
jgi:hypothetical protein